MAAPQSNIPPRGSYRFVLIRDDVRPAQQQLATAYDETCRSRPVEWKGKTVSALFVQKRTSVARFTKLGRAPTFGWTDITEEWHRRIEEGTVLRDGKEPPEGDAGLVLVALEDGEPHARSDIEEQTGLTGDQVLAALGELTSDGWVERRGKGRSTAYQLAG